MIVDSSKVQFYSGTPIDKIELYSIQTDSSPGLDKAYGGQVSAGGPTSPTFALGSVLNTFGKKGIPHMSWSLDNINYYDQTDQSNASANVSVICGCADAKIYFYFQNQLASPQLIYVKFAVSSIS